MEIAIMTLKLIFGLSILYVLLWLGFYNCNHCFFVDWFIKDERQRYKIESEKVKK